MSQSSAPVNKRARIKARRSVVQALYEWLMTGKDIADVIAEFESDKQTLAKTDVKYFKQLFRRTIKHKQALEDRIVHLLDRPIDELGTIERAILYIGCYELEHQLEIPWRVVINESVELAKLFGAEESHKYINGVLDKLAREIRVTEINAAV